uniref:lysozyme n=1 Tax=Plautia stali TaxID=106108 RepID=A0A499U6F4_PLAST|nr:C-type lysozyme [Plautia stali]
MLVRILFCALFAAAVESSIISRCRLARDLRESGIRLSLIPDWICLAEAVSNRNTTARGGPYGSDVHTYGIFQIGSNIWCDIGKRGKKCNVDCEDLIGDNVEESISCAIEIYADYGFSAWSAWVSKCKGKSTPDISHCLRD